MTATEQINTWIKEHGSTRVALNVALARLDCTLAEVERHERLFAMINTNCPNCNAFSWVVESSRNGLRCSYCNTEYNDDPRD